MVKSNKSDAWRRPLPRIAHPKPLKAVTTVVLVVSVVAVVLWMLISIQ
jgi:hypothetical protein